MTPSPRRTAAVLALAALLALGAPAHAEDDVTPLDPGITPLEENIRPLETISTQGRTTRVTLQADILFPFGSAELGEPARARIAELVAEVPQGARVTVEGHTDAIPYARGNQVLSEERAQAVATVIARSRPDLSLTVTGYGDSRPVAPEVVAGKDDPEARAQNRRVEISYEG